MFVAQSTATTWPEEVRRLARARGAVDCPRRARVGGRRPAGDGGTNGCRSSDRPGG